MGPEEFDILPEVPNAVQTLKEQGFRLGIITNQSGISKKVYPLQAMQACHDMLQEACQHAFEVILYSPYHPSISQSLGRKPGSLLFERAMGLFGYPVGHAGQAPRQYAQNFYMLGDKDRDLAPAHALGMHTIQITHGIVPGIRPVPQLSFTPTAVFENVAQATTFILKQEGLA